jgi:hypothetical protein
MAKPSAKKEAKLDDSEPLSDGTFAYKGKAKEPEPALALEGGKAGSVVLKTPPADYNVDRAPTHRHASSAGAASAPPKAMRSVAKDGSGDDMKLLQPNDGFGGTVGGGGLGRGDVAKSSAPGTQSLARLQNQNGQAQAAGPPPPPSVPLETARAPSANKEQHVVTREVEPQAPPSAAPAPVTSSRDADYGNVVREKAAVLKPAATTATANVESERKHFYELAKSNRCDEAIKVFADLERMTQLITPNERVQYVHCLTQKGRQQEAEQQLLELKADKRLTNNEVQKLQDELDNTRPKPRRADKKKAMTLTPTPVDLRHAEPATESPAQQAQQAPAQAAPPPAAAAPSRKSDRNTTKSAPSY